MNPYAVFGIGASLVGMTLGAAVMHYTFDAWALSRVSMRLGEAKLARAQDKVQALADLKAVSDMAASAASDAQAKQQSMQQRSDFLQTTLDKSMGEKNGRDRQYRHDLAAGAVRLRVAIAACDATVDSSGREHTAGAPESTGRNVGSAAYADLDPAFASALFAFAADEQREIDKLRKLQAWACVVKPDAPGCEGAIAHTM